MKGKEKEMLKKLFLESVGTNEIIKQELEKSTELLQKIYNALLIISLMIGILLILC